MRRRSLLRVFMVPLFGLAPPAVAAAESPPAGHVVAMASGERLSKAALLDRLAGARILLVGELHDRTEHHRIERWLLRSLHRRRPLAGVVLEMYGADAQDRLNRLGDWVGNGGRVRSQTLRDRSGWDPGWPWGDYGPFVVEAMTAGIPILAGNLSARDLAHLRKPVAGDATAATVTAPHDHARATAMFTSMHGGDTTPDRLAAMARIQAARDRRMAQMVTQSAGPVMLVAGRAHVLRGIGVPTHLSADASDAAVVLVLAVEGEEVDPRDADYAWFVPES